MFTAPTSHESFSFVTLPHLNTFAAAANVVAGATTAAACPSNCLIVLYFPYLLFAASLLCVNICLVEFVVCIAYAFDDERKTDDNVVE